MKKFSMFSPHLLPAILLVAQLQHSLANTETSPGIPTSDGGIYKGPVVNGLFQGHGRKEWSNGSVYEGEFDKGLFSGKGIYKNPTHSYEGIFVKGYPSGHGKTILADGSVYTGEHANGLMHGQGKIEYSDGTIYEGSFENGSAQGLGKLVRHDMEYTGHFNKWLYGGRGELTYKNGSKYTGEFAKGLFHGKGRYASEIGDVYEGDFINGVFTGKGIATKKDGSRHEGEFVKWVPNGPGRFIGPKDSYVIEGKFSDGQMNGKGIMTAPGNMHYEGDFKKSRFHGAGELKLENGDVYKGGFAHGTYEGQGTLTYAKPQDDGRTQDRGVWHYGSLENKAEELQTKTNVEKAIYNQRILLDKALSSIKPHDPSKINLYLLAIAGHGGQEVFRKEVEFVRNQFDRDFSTAGRSLMLVNSRNTVEQAPMATRTSIRESLNRIANFMDREKDILFIFLTSHGSKNHEFTLDQNGMDLQSLPATELGAVIKETGIRWKVIVVSSCYSGGFIDPLKDDNTMIITAARHDRSSFGCSDKNDFTYFGKAFFKESIPASDSFKNAFYMAEKLIENREAEDSKDDDKTNPEKHSLPQIHAPAPIEEHLKKWHAQLTQGKPTLVSVQEPSK